VHLRFHLLSLPPEVSDLRGLGRSSRRGNASHTPDERLFVRFVDGLADTVDVSALVAGPPPPNLGPLRGPSPQGEGGVFGEAMPGICRLLPRDAGFAPSQHELLYLTRRRLRKLVDEADPLRCLEVGQTVAHVKLELFLGGFGTVS